MKSAGLVAAWFLASAAASALDVREHYTKREVMVPMRDGVQLFTILYEPKERSETYPILLLRTPYSIPPYGPDEYRDQLGPSPAFDEEGFIFVFQDVRGKFRSEGEFVVMRAYDSDGGSDDSTDNYDTIEWLLGNVENHNGKVGQYGVSYPGFQTVMGMIDAHPALVASSPQASPSDMFIGDDWHHNGAFRLMYAFSWLSKNAQVRDELTTERVKAFDYKTPDGYRFFLECFWRGKCCVRSSETASPTRSRWFLYRRLPSSSACETGTIRSRRVIA